MPTWGILSNIKDYEKLRNRYGVEVLKIPYTDIFSFMDKIDDREASQIAESLEKNARENKVKNNWLVNDIKYYLAAKEIMTFYGCNSFTTSCVELCRSLIPQERKFVPCITHSLLKDEGYPSGCEEDINALLAMIIMMYAAERPAFMGNPLYENEQLISLHHSVPCLKMNGFETKKLEYDIYTFTNQGFGGKIQVDFAENCDQKVTLGRFDPKGKKLLVKTGDVIKSEYTNFYCSPYYFIKMNNARDYIHNLMDFGHHQALIYGDWIKELKMVSKILGFEVIEG